MLVRVGTENRQHVLGHISLLLLGGIVLAAFLAAIMSAADSLLAAAASYLVKDLRRPAWCIAIRMPPPNCESQSESQPWRDWLLC